MCCNGHPRTDDNLYVSPDGRRHCRACRRAAARRHYWRNRDKVRERQNRYAQANREQLNAAAARYRKTEAFSEAQKRYYYKNREDRIESARDWAQQNRERRREWYRAFRATRHGKRLQAIKGATRRARESNAAGDCSSEQLEARFDFYGGNCWMCGDEGDTVDHVIPLVEGGTNWPANLRPACMPCNQRKGTRSWKNLEEV